MLLPSENIIFPQSTIHVYNMFNSVFDLWKDTKLNFYKQYYNHNNNIPNWKESQEQREENLL